MAHESVTAAGSGEKQEPPFSGAKPKKQLLGTSSLFRHSQLLGRPAGSLADESLQRHGAFDLGGASGPRASPPSRPPTGTVIIRVVTSSAIHAPPKPAICEPSNRPVTAAFGGRGGSSSSGSGSGRMQRRKRPAVRAVEEAVDGSERIDPETGETVVIAVDVPSCKQEEAVDALVEAERKGDHRLGNRPVTAEADQVLDDGADNCYQCRLCAFGKDAEDDGWHTAAGAAKRPMSEASPPRMQRPGVAAFGSLQALIEHVTREHVKCEVSFDESGRRKLTCPLCRRHFVVYAGVEDGYRRLVLHARDQHGRPLPAHYQSSEAALAAAALPLPPSKGAVSPAECPVCGILRPTRSSLSAHVRQCHSDTGGPGLVSCPVCSQCLLESSAATHMQFKHRERYERLAAYAPIPSVTCSGGGSCSDDDLDMLQTARLSSQQQQGDSLAEVPHPAAGGAPVGRPRDAAVQPIKRSASGSTIARAEVAALVGGGGSRSSTQQQVASESAAALLRTTALLIPRAGEFKVMAAEVSAAKIAKEETQASKPFVPRRPLLSPISAVADGTAKSMHTTSGFQMETACTDDSHVLFRAACDTQLQSLADGSIPRLKADASSSSSCDARSGRKDTLTACAAPAGSIGGGIGAGSACLGGEERLMCKRCCKRILGAHNLSRHMVLVHGVTEGQLP